jgi:hypothetical protein
MANGVDADQDVAADRPIYNEGGGLSWLQFPGGNKSLTTSHYFPDMYQDFLLAAGIQLDNLDGPLRAQAYFGPYNSPTTYYSFLGARASQGRVLQLGVYTRQYVAGTGGAASVGYGVPDPMLFVNTATRTGEALSHDVNGMYPSFGTAPSGANFNGILSIGHYVPMRFYGGVYYRETTPDIIRNKTREYLAKLSGVTL